MSPDPVVSALAEQQDELAAILAGLAIDDWSSASRCAGWSVADVVLHLAQTNEMAIGSLRGTFDDVAGHLADGVSGVDVDEVVDGIVAKERGVDPRALRQRWADGAAAQVDAFGAIDLSTRVRWVAGGLSARTLAVTRLAETWIHTGDVAAPLGVVLVPTDRLRHIARLAWRTLPYAFARAGRRLSGPVAFELSGPLGDRWDFVPDPPMLTTIRGDAEELCLVAARRVDSAATSLAGEGPDVAAVLELVRTYA